MSAPSRAAARYWGAVGGRLGGRPRADGSPARHDPSRWKPLPPPPPASAPASRPPRLRHGDVVAGGELDAGPGPPRLLRPGASPPRRRGVPGFPPDF